MIEAPQDSKIVALASRREGLLKKLATGEARQFIQPFTAIEEGRQQISECLVAAEDAHREVMRAVYHGATPEVQGMLLEASTVRECRQILDQESHQGSAMDRLKRIRELVNESAVTLVEVFKKIDSTLPLSAEQDGVAILKDFIEKRTREHNLDALNTALIKLSDQIFLLEGAVLGIVMAFQEISDSLQRKIKPTDADAQTGNLTPFFLDDDVRGKLRQALAALNEEGSALSSLNDRLDVFEDTSIDAVWTYLEAVGKGEVMPGDKKK